MNVTRPNSLSFFFILVIFLIAIMAPYSHTETEEENIVVICPINGEINKGMAYFIHRGLEEAKSKNAKLIIFEIDTNGGRLDATEEIMQMLLSSSIPTASFINNKAFSAGAFIAVATDKIYMSPASVIGAATPVSVSSTGSPQETSSSFEEKITSGTKALIKTAAQHNGHPDDIVSAMVDRDIKIRGVIEEGKLLTLTNIEAESKKIQLSLGTVKNIDELLERENMSDYTVEEIIPSWSEGLALLITNSGVSGVLMMIGMMSIYLEFKTPGWGLGGTLALICFALFFWGHRIAGLAGMEDLLLFGIGAILLAIEIFFIPGFGYAGILGLICVFISLVLAMIRRPIFIPQGESFWPTQMPNLAGPSLSLSIAVIGSAAGIVMLSKYLPRTKLWSSFALLKEQRKDLGYSTAIKDFKNLHIGQAGQTLTVLRPSGKVQINDKQYDVLTEDVFIEKDTRVKIIRIDGNTIFVEKLS